MMTAHSIELIRRLCYSYDEYFPKVTDDRLLAMTVNPVMATKGFDDIVKLLADDGSGEVLKARAKALLKQYILNVLRAEERAEEISQAKAGEKASESDPVITPSDTNIMTAKPKCTLSRTERLKQSKAAKVQAEEVRSNKEVDLETQAEKEVEAFFLQKFDPKQELEDQRARMKKGCADIDWKRVREQDLLYISSKFDSLEWWDKVGRKSHKKVFCVAPIVIALPTHNGYQERTFSICTWFNSPIRQRLEGSRFEMAVLLAVNEALLSCDVPTEDEAKEIVKEVVQKVVSTHEKAEMDVIPGTEC